MKKVFITYRIESVNPDFMVNEDWEFRKSLLGDKHWNAVSYNGFSKTITVSVSGKDTEIMTMFKLRYPNCEVEERGNA